MNPRDLPVRSRSQSVILLLGVVLGLMLAGLAIPFVYGERLSTDALAPASAQSGQQLSGEQLPGEQSVTDPSSLATPGASDVAGAAVPPPLEQGASAGSAPGAGSAPATGKSGGGPPAAGEPGAAGGGSADTAPRTASDRGVTANGIKVGFTILDVGGAGRVGIDVGISVAQQRDAWAAYAKEINGRGGINGRKIEPVYQSYDPTNESSQRQACLRLTQDEKVFAVLGGFNYPSATSCLTREGQTPTVNALAMNQDDVYRQAAGRFITLFPSASRQMALTVAALDAAGKLKGRTIGILGGTANDPGARTSAALESALKARGLTVKRRVDVSADSGTASSQVPVAVGQMQRDGVNTVFLLSGPVSATQFVNQAEGQAYRPAYHTTDWASLNNDVSTGNMPRSFDGSVGTTFYAGYGNKRPPFKENQPATRCRDIHDRHSGRKLTQGTAEYAITLQNCDAIVVFERAAALAGTNLTRQGLVGAVQRAGSVAVSSYGQGSYGSGKFDYSDNLRLQVWRADCSCWIGTGGWLRPRV